MKVISPASLCPDLPGLYPVSTSSRLLPRPPIYLPLGEAISRLSLLSGYKTNPIAKEYGRVSPLLSSPPGGILHH